MEENLFELAYQTLLQKFYILGGNPYQYPIPEDLEAEWGASRICIFLDDCVLKKNLTGTGEWKEGVNHRDWLCPEEDVILTDVEEIQHTCEKEVLLYKLAEKEGVERFFTKLEYIGDNIYKQALAKHISLFSDSRDEDYEGKLKEKCKSLGLEELLKRSDTITTHSFLEEYPIDDLLKLQAFLVKYNVTDLVQRNVGWVNGVLQIFDYDFNDAKEEDLNA